jgi:glutamyl-tRNA synthetase
VDDADQGVDQVVRGDDLIDSTPRQILLARLLGLAQPAYAHVPLVLGPDGQRLAKRHGAVTLADLAPEEALAWMAASLNLTLPVLENFAPERLPREPTTWQT